MYQVVESSGCNFVWGTSKQREYQDPIGDLRITKLEYYHNSLVWGKTLQAAPNTQNGFVSGANTNEQCNNSARM
jgi:hypothetical protein